MSDYWQYIVVGCVVVAAFALSLRSLWRALHNKKSALNPCSSCKLKESCTKNKDQCEEKN